MLNRRPPHADRPALPRAFSGAPWTLILRIAVEFPIEITRSRLLMTMSINNHYFRPRTPHKLSPHQREHFPGRNDAENIRDLRTDRNRESGCLEQARRRGVGWALGVAKIGSMSGPILAGVLLAAGFSVRGLFAAVPIPLFVGLLSAIALMALYNTHIHRTRDVVVAAD
jgi:hypothetical protein